MGATWASVDLLSQLSACPLWKNHYRYTVQDAGMFLYDAIASPKKERAPG